MKSIFLKYLSFAALSVFFCSLALEVSAEPSSDKELPQNIPFETIARLNGKDMAAAAMKLLNQYGWNGWNGDSRANNDGLYPKDKESFFNDWVSGKGFEWIDPVWAYSDSDSEVSRINTTCKNIGSDPEIYKKSRWQSNSRSSPSLHIGLSPAAIYKIDSSKLAKNAEKQNLAVIVKFNLFDGKRIIDSGAIDMNHSSIEGEAYLYDLDKCVYQIVGDLGNGYLDGYREGVQTWLTGVGYYKGKMAVYSILDRAEYAAGGPQKKELSASLHLFIRGAKSIELGGLSLLHTDNTLLKRRGRK